MCRRTSWLADTRAYGVTVRVLSGCAGFGETLGMKTRCIYRGYRFAPEIIAHTVWLYHRFALSLRDVEDLFADRGIEVSYEKISSMVREVWASVCPVYQGAPWKAGRPMVSRCYGI